MQIETNGGDVHIELGMLHATLLISVEGKPFAISFTMSVEEAERATVEDIQPNCTVQEL